MAPHPHTSNGSSNRANMTPTHLNRAEEVEDLIDAVKALIIPFIRAADDAAPSKVTGRTRLGENGLQHNVLVESKRPTQLINAMNFSLPEEDGRGKNGLLDTIQSILQYSVNTWDQGFLDKLYSSTNAVHVYQVSPALTVIEKTTSRNFAHLFGFTGPRAGGITCQGGSSSNLTSIVIARNTLYPATKASGNDGHQFVLFTSEHGHYSVEKAAVTCGIGAANVVSVPIDDTGRMIPEALREAILKSKAEGKTALYINATAGTTVLGSYDPFRALSAIAREFNLWLHIDASWGGPAIFSPTQRHKLDGSELANSITVNPHKMLNTPVTCSFLLTGDMAVFHAANTLAAGYLFHSDGAQADDEVWDLADLTLQCGRRADSLKLALAWVYYGKAGFASQVDHAFTMAAYLADLVDRHPDLQLVSTNPPPCLQVCFYYAPGGQPAEEKEENTRRTREIVERLIGRGFMVDYAPGDKGSFFRVVVNCQTLRGTVKGLMRGLEEAGREVMA